MTPVAELVVDAVRAGVLLIADGGGLRYKARKSMPMDLAARLKVHRDDLLALLNPVEAVPTSIPTPDLIAEIREAFAPWTLEVVAVRPARFDAENPARQPIIDLLLPIFRRDPERGIALRDAWAERMATATIDGGMSEAEAEEIALEEVKKLLTSDEIMG